jgi:hypothetical protein
MSVQKRARYRDPRSLAIAGAICFFAALNLLLPDRLPFQRAFISLAKRDAGVGASIVGTAGVWQIANINTAFATPLRVQVNDFVGKPLIGVPVTFSTPATGPSASFGGSVTAVVKSDNRGIATAPPLTANSNQGGYQVFATVQGAGEAPTYFSLTNAPGGPVQASAPALTENGARHALHLAIYLIDVCAFLAGGIYVISLLARRSASGNRLFSIAATVALSVSVFIILATFARDEGFAPVETLMTNPGALPVYGQRLLVVWFADALKFALPSFSYRRAYLATQLIAIFAATYMIGEWSALFVGSRRKLLGQLILVAMLIPTITYGTFYDIPMIAIYTLCLFLLYTRRYSLFIAAFTIGTLNHENTLLLVAVAAAVLWGTTSWRLFLGVPLGALAAWVTIRTAVQRLMPEPLPFELHVWTNVMAIAHPSAELVKSFLTLAFWFICAAVGFRSADRFVRRAVILLPGLVAATFVAGRFVEARQFDAFIPVAIALILSHIGRQADWSLPKIQSLEQDHTIPERALKASSAG